jgi:hypothetical protein
LDCFWEGSKPLGPFPAIGVPEIIAIILPEGTLKNPASWKNINTKRLMDGLQGIEALINLDLSMVRELFTRMGIATAYQTKPCLNPFDPECPKTAPNYRNGSYAVDYGALMTGGCRGLAENIMQWPEQLIIGGLEKDQNSKIVQ